MSLRDELQDSLRWKLSEHPAMQEAYKTGEYERLVELPPHEAAALLLTMYGGLREAIFRLADEVDALKLDTGR
jgi:hypothetical protein